MTWLSKAQAYAQAERLAYHIRKYGVKTVIDLKPGANGKWGTDTFYAPMAHHIASHKGQGNTPFYSLVRNGRGGREPVPGPLANVYGGWDLVARIITMGIANHSGKGGPWNISGFIIPRNNGRYYFLGTEFEGGLNEADWDADYRRFMGAVNAGKLDYINELRGGIIKDTALTEHSMWAAGRKIDRAGYTHERGIKEMQAARRTKEPVPVKVINPLEDDMPRTLYTFFFINGKHHVVNNVTGVYYEISKEQADQLTEWWRRRGTKWDWHKSEITGSREVAPKDLVWVAPQGKAVLGGARP